MKEEQQHPKRTRRILFDQPAASKKTEDEEETEIGPEAETGANVVKKQKRSLEKPMKVFGALCIAASIVSLVFSGTSSVNSSESAKNALVNQSSTAISAGTVLLSKDEQLSEQDHTITHNSAANETRIWVWDYAAEDGDYVQVLVNGASVTDEFMIKHKPKEIIVPATGEIQIKGIRDGGGGITYAVRYEVNNTSYFNSAPEGKANTYTLVRE